MIRTRTNVEKLAGQKIHATHVVTRAVHSAR